MYIKDIIVITMTLVVFPCCVQQGNGTIDIGQGFSANMLNAPWTGKSDNTRFSCHSTDESFFFNFEVEDSTLSILEDWKDERIVDSEDRVELFFAPARSLKNGYYCAEIDAEGRVMDYEAKYYREFDFAWDFKTLEVESMTTTWGYRIAGKISRKELKKLGVDLDKKFRLGVFRADMQRDCNFEWYSIVVTDQKEPDFHVPDVFMECTAHPKMENSGVVIYPDDITSLGLEEWEKRIALSGIKTIGLHAATVNDPIDTLKSFLLSNKGRDFLAMCARKGVDVEYELHSLEYLLPRNLYDLHPEFFRMDTCGRRCYDYNMCFSCEDAYEAMRPQLESLLKWVKPTTHRYYFWADDRIGKFCHCPRCSGLSPSEQILNYENHLLSMIREYDSEATLAHLAYQQTLPAPVAIRADDGIFLEFAPMERNYELPLGCELSKALEENLMAFPCHTQHILEYWLDESMFCHWNKSDPVSLPVTRTQIERDIRTYRKKGATDFTCFATWLNGRYIQEFGSTDNIFQSYGKAF